MSEFDGVTTRDLLIEVRQDVRQINDRVYEIEKTMLKREGPIAQAFESHESRILVLEERTKAEDRLMGARRWALGFAAIIAAGLCVPVLGIFFGGQG